MKIYKNYIFDFYGTLVDIRTDENKLELWEYLADLYNSFGCTYRARQLKSCFETIASEEEINLIRTSPHEFVEIDLEKVFVRLLTDAKCTRQTLNTPKDLKTFGQMIANIFRILSREKLEAYPNTLSVLDTLQEKGSHLIILSNAQQVFTQAEIEQTGCADFMEKIYISSDYQMKKPEPAFLQMVMEQNNFNPEETLLVGNDLTTDIAIAQELGVDAVLLNTFSFGSQEIDAYRNKGWNFTVIEDIAELIY
ncbi:TPA: HAD family hydrolase [Streptococcus suis]